MRNLWRICWLLQFIIVSTTSDETVVAEATALEQEDPVGIQSSPNSGNQKTPTKIASNNTSTANVTASTNSNANLTTTNMNLNSTVVDCQNITSDLLTTDQDYCCFGPVIFAEETLYNCQVNLKSRADWFYDDPPDNECVAQCMFEARNISSNNTIDQAVLLNETLRNRVNDRDIWQPIVQTAIGECLKPERTQVNATGPQGCSPLSYKVLHCLYVELLKNCPSSKRNNDPKCLYLTNFATTCQEIPKQKSFVYN